MTEHRYSVERLVHYRCCHCDRWWSIGDGPTEYHDELLICPWCGQVAKLSEIKKERSA